MRPVDYLYRKLDVVVLVAIMLFLITLLSGCASSGVAGGVAETPVAPPEETWGITVESVRLSAADYMLDFRYRVTDAHKAAKLIRPGLKPYLTDQASGWRLQVPAPSKLGPLSQARHAPVQGKVYFVFFANPGRHVRPGARVDVALGAATFRDLVVQGGVP